MGPFVVPVHNYGAGGNTPPYWLPPPSGLGWRHAMFNAVYVKGKNKSSLAENLTAWVDSGAFLIIDSKVRRLAGRHGRKRYSTLEWSDGIVEEILRAQERFGADWAFTFDYPLPPASQVSETFDKEVWERVSSTARAAATAYQLRTRNSMKLVVVLQFNSKASLKALLDLLDRELKERAGMRVEEVDAFAVGGLVPHYAKWWLLVRRLQQAREALSWEKHVHLLGVASPRNVPLLYLAGADSMDSKTFIIAAAKRLKYLPLWKRPSRVKVRTPEGVQPSEFVRKLAMHNLNVTLDAARLAGELAGEGRLVEVLKEVAREDRRLARALKELRIPRPSPS